MPPTDLAALTAMETSGKLTATQAKQVLAELIASGGGDPAAIAAAKGFEAMDSSALESLVDEAIAANPGAWAKYVAGEDKAIGALVGAVMKASAVRPMAPPPRRSSKGRRAPAESAFQRASVDRSRRQADHTRATCSALPSRRISWSWKGIGLARSMCLAQCVASVTTTTPSAESRRATSNRRSVDADQGGDAHTPESSAGIAAHSSSPDCSSSSRRSSSSSRSRDPPLRPAKNPVLPPVVLPRAIDR